MSLINDALKRARQAQPPTPPAESSNHHLHPVEPAHHVRHGLGVLVPVSFAGLALLVLLLLWQRYEGLKAARNGHGDAPNTLVAEAKSLPIADPAPAPPEPAPAAVAPSAPTPAVTNSAPTNAVATPEPPPEKPAPLKLQGIIYSPNRASAVINGKTVFVGDRIRDFRVVAITRDSATLAGASEKQVLRLDE
jgi:hypothetical protein